MFLIIILFYFVLVISINIKTLLIIVIQFYAINAILNCAVKAEIFLYNFIIM